MEHDQMYFVIDGHAITLDETGTPVICDVDQNGIVDWDSEDLIDWMDLLPDEYQLYKAVVDFLLQYTPAMYVK